MDGDHKAVAPDAMEIEQVQEKFKAMEHSEQHYFNR